MPAIRLGEKSSKSLVVLVAGFPDTATSAFGTLLDSLAENHRVYAICFPGYESSSMTKSKRRSWGYSWSEILEGLHFTIQELKKEDGIVIESFFLIGHDWGSHLSLLYQIKHSSEVKKLVLLDVLTANRGQQLNYFQMISILSYQWSFALIYLIHELASKYLGNLLFNLVAYTFLSIIFPSIGRPRRRMSEVDASFLYPYFYFWRDYFFYSAQQPSFPSCATLLLYGADKTLHFHGSHAAAELSSMPNCVVKSIPGGHWFHLQQPVKVLKEIRTFFGDN